MNAFLLQLVAVATSFILALPPGWCRAMHKDQTSSVPAKAPCCQGATTHEPSDSGNAPTQPSVECCCSQNTTLPEKPVELTETSGLGLPLLAENVIPDLGLRSLDEAIVAFADSGPRLHILQCVWRC